MSLVISPIDESDIFNIANIAQPIWNEHYAPIIGEKQVKYMLEKFQSTEAIRQQCSQGYKYFKVNWKGLLCGYFAFQLRNNNSLFVSKFYLTKEVRGNGLGRKMLTYIEKLAKTEQCTSIDLTVNKYNPAYEVYLKLGFNNKGSIEFDIGGGYIMDDYLLTKEVR